MNTFIAFVMAILLLFVPMVHTAQAATYTTVAPCIIPGGSCPDGSYPCRRGNGAFTCDCPTM